MEYQRSERVGDLLLEVTSELLRREIRDPRLRDVALTAVKLSKDLRHARIYFNLLGGSANHDDATAGLKSASGFIRTKAAKQLNLRFVPNIEFTYDESADEAQRIDALLKQANKTEE